MFIWRESLSRGRKLEIVKEKSNYRPVFENYVVQQQGFLKFKLYLCVKI